MPVRVLAEQLSADELTDYQAFYMLEPWGCLAADVRAAIVAHTVASCHSTKPIPFETFLPRWEPVREVSYAEGAKAFEAFLRS